DKQGRLSLGAQLFRALFRCLERNLQALQEPGASDPDLTTLDVSLHAPARFRFELADGGERDSPPARALDDRVRQRMLTGPTFFFAWTTTRSDFVLMVNSCDTTDVTTPRASCPPSWA